MPPKFRELTLAELDELVDHYPFTRRIDSVHMHHTWRPRRADYRGEPTIDGMWRYHTKTNGWSDIAQHLTIAPTGTVWLGRDWNQAPSSAKRFNGNGEAGPFMFEIVGDFDVGREPLDGPQREAVVHVIAKIRERFALPATALRFHNEMNSGKSCPGTSVDKAAILAEVEREIGVIRSTRRAVRGFRWADSQYEADVARARSIVSEFRVARGPAPANEDEELAESAGGEAAGMRGSGLTPDRLAALRGHVVSMRNGAFTTHGEMPTAARDVDAIFERAIPDWWRTSAPGRPLRLMLWAHGGLTDEGAGLTIAAKQAEWWKRNGVYPLFFVWETGFLDALEQLFSQRDRALRGARDFWDWTTDPGIEAAARALGIPGIWGAMKDNAARASAVGGAARHVGERLAAFCRTAGQAGGVEIFAAGHSAGSIFHAHFLPVALAAGMPAVRELFLLAPAIRVDAFKRTLLPLVGTQVRKLTMLTMTEALERADSVGPYRKSLLYLVGNALEGGAGHSPILGLQESVRADRDLSALFALDGGPQRDAQVVWSDGSDPGSAREASTSRSHGAFDDNRASMNTLAYRMGVVDGLHDFPTDQRFIAPAAVVSSGGRPAPTGAGGRRLAVCIGIDAYPDPRYVLGGCVADARAWQAALEARGFEVRACHDAQATRAGIVAALTDVVGGSRPGDVLALQFAGHGTQLNDLDGDEEDAIDEAFVPYDFANGGYLLDDDLWGVFAAVPDGVALTCFFDCCHSGTITRVMGLPPPPLPPGARARYMKPTDEMNAAHRAFRSRQARAVTPRASRDRQAMRTVVFAACQDDQVAYELGGHGEFTKRALPILQQGGVLTNAQFADAVVQAFGAAPRQMPRLDCPDAARTLVLLGPLTGGRPAVVAPPSSGTPAPSVGPAPLAPGPFDRAGIALRLREVADLIDAGR